MSATIHQGHTLAVLQTLPDHSVHTVVTSPPYWGLRDYGTDPVPWPAVDYAPMPGLPPQSIPAMSASLGLEPTLESFIGHLVLIFREIKRILHPTGTLWLNMGDGYAQSPGQHKAEDDVKAGAKQQTNAGSHLTRPHPGSLKPKDLQGQPWRLAFALQAAGYHLRNDIIWAKPNPMPESTTDRCTKSHEYLFLLTPSKDYFFDQEAIKENAAQPAGAPKLTAQHKSTAGGFTTNGTGASTLGSNCGPDTRNKRTVWTVPTSPYPEAHFATFPPELITPCILAGTSPRGACPTCLAPWERDVEKERTFHSGSGKSGNPINGKHGVRMQGGGETKDIRKGPIVTATTTGWKPTCRCADDRGPHAPSRVPAGASPGTVPPPSPIPCTVLDPFLGSGTTAQVALELGRLAIGIELNHQYITLAKNRLTRTTPGLPLF